jgi:peptidoglycan/LPS O-acetylase OafA/YrhL
MTLGPFCALAVLAITPWPLQALFATRPVVFLGGCRLMSCTGCAGRPTLGLLYGTAGYISLSLYLWHETFLASFGAWLFLRLHVDLGWAYSASSLASGAFTAAVLLPFCYVYTKAVDEQCVRLAATAYRSLFTPYNDQIPAHRLIRRAERWVH